MVADFGMTSLEIGFDTLLSRTMKVIVAPQGDMEKLSLVVVKSARIIAAETILPRLKLLLR